MRTANTQPTSCPAAPTDQRTPMVCVVDPQAADYQGWQATADAHGLRLKVVASAEEALRLARAGSVDLWVVNTDLPGLSGFELCSMLKARSARTAVYLVANEYSVAAERAAWGARATLFGCKGTHAAWLNEWIGSCSPNVLNPSVRSPRVSEAIAC